MNNGLRRFLSGLIAGALVSGTSVYTLLSSVTLDNITPEQWVLMGLGGAAAALKDWRTFLANPYR